MGIYVCLLRGINVSGHNSVKMEALRAAFEDLDFKGVETYVQSGNVVFESRAAGTASLATKIQTKMKSEFGIDVPVLLKSAGDLRKAVSQNLFAREMGINPGTLHVTFLAKRPRRDGLDRIAAIKAGADRFIFRAGQIYLHCPHGYGKTKLNNSALENALSLTATTRNWRTVNALCEMCSRKIRKKRR